jgi:cob(I)alamin adenosyltransferase
VTGCLLAGPAEVIWMAEETTLGKVHVITGPGKGKTTAAFGLALRAAGHGVSVCIIQFMKTGETTGEVLAVGKVPGIEVHQFGTGRFIGPAGATDEDRACAGRALALASEVARKGSCGMLVLDEVNVAADLGLVRAEEVVDILKARRQGLEVVLTGRNAPEAFLDCADYVSVVDSPKHPFKQGTGARKGVEW